MPQFHGHIGAGAIGLACVIPLLKTQGKRLLVVNRVGDRFDRTRTEHAGWQQYVRTQNNTGDLVVKTTHPAPDIRLDPTHSEYFRLIVPRHLGRDLSSAQLEECERTLEQRDVYVLTDNFEQLAQLLDHATSLSTALHDDGQKRLADSINTLAGRLAPKPIFLFENRNIFQSNVDPSWRKGVVHVVVDRICLHRPSRYEDGRVIEHVLCEQHLTLWSTNVLLTPPPKYWKTIEDKQKDFFERRKRYLVNSVHTIVAMLGYQRLAAKRIENIEHSRQILSVVLDGVLGDPVAKRVIEVFLAARVQQLLIEIPRTARPKGFADDETAYLQLMAEGEDIIKRIRRFPDVMGRVLHSDERKKIHDRWTRHVEDLITSVKTRKAEYLRFGARERPHVREIEAALKRIQEAARGLVFPD